MMISGHGITGVSSRHRHILAWREWQGGKIWELVAGLFSDERVDEVLAPLSLDAGAFDRAARGGMHTETLTFAMQTIALEGYALAQQGIRCILGAWIVFLCVARSGVTVTRLLCDPLPYKNVLKVPHAKNLG
jgi:hypothetical protein